MFFPLALLSSLRYEVRAWLELEGHAPVKEQRMLRSSSPATFGGALQYSIVPYLPLCTLQTLSTPIHPKAAAAALQCLAQNSAESKEEERGEAAWMVHAQCCRRGEAANYCGRL